MVMIRALYIFIILLSASRLVAGEIILQSTTSTKNSGSYDYILPLVKKSIDVDVKVVAVGTGQAIENSKRCDGDVLLVHDQESEIEFVDKGYGVKRYDLMYNDFIVVGPIEDELNLRNETDIKTVLRKIYESQKIFLSRSDNSGTHRKENKLWELANLKPLKYSGGWYLETGLGMGATLNIAAGKNAYTVTDRATWISFRNKSDLDILFEGHPALFNQYGIIVIDKNFCPNVNISDAEKFVKWLMSEKGQEIIDSFRLGNEQLFFRSN